MPLCALIKQASSNYVLYSLSLALFNLVRFWSCGNHNVTTTLRINTVVIKHALTAPGPGGCAQVASCIKANLIKLLWGMEHAHTGKYTKW